VGHIQNSIQRIDSTFSPGVIWPKREADHSPVLNADVKTNGALNYGPVPLPFPPVYVYVTYRDRSDVYVTVHRDIFL
jgi:hypothetical protein